jgi:leucyl aminopeptidase (aminopeptidase T)
MVKERKSIEIAIGSLLDVNLGVKDDERILVLGDHGEDVMEPDLASEVGDLVKRIRRDTSLAIYPSTGRSGVEPPLEAWEAAFGSKTAQRLSEKGIFERLMTKSASANDLKLAEEIAQNANAVDVVIALAYHSTSHTAFRKLLTQSAGVRYASMPHFHRDMFFGSMDVDWHRLADSTRALARAVEGVDLFEITADNGTDMTMGVSGRRVNVDDGLLTEAGSFGNLPAGEVFLAPVEGTAEGTMVIEWGPTAKLGSPLTVTLKEGRAVSVSGDNTDDVKWLEDLWAAHPDNNNIAELGIGTNPGATRPDSILESEKILGTVHIAFGDNHTFGGNVVAPFHLDFVVYKANLVAVWDRGGGRRVLLAEGKPGW